MQHHRLPHERYGALVGKLLRQQPLSAADLAHGHTSASGSLGASGSANISGGGGSGNGANDDSASAAYRHHDGEGSAASAAAAAMADTSVKRLHVNQVCFVMFLASSGLSCMSQCTRLFCLGSVFAIFHICSGFKRSMPFLSHFDVILSSVLYNHHQPRIAIRHHGPCHSFLLTMLLLFTAAPPGQPQEGVGSRPALDQGRLARVDAPFLGCVCELST
jgi:hypothetical protein